MEITPNTAVLLLAAISDYLIGDPWGWLHPVQVMGWVIAGWTQFALNTWRKPWQRRLAGLGLGWGVFLGSGLVGWLIVRFAYLLHPVLGISSKIILLASCFAGHSLRLAALAVLSPLEAGNLDLARSKLSQYVGRDTDNLSETEILRAILETIAENTADGVTSPLFYGVLGCFLPAVGSVPFALAYKAASTLDSMVGYCQEPYRDLGWFSAKGEDCLTWLPCRLTVLTLALISGQPKRVLKLCWRDASRDPSPNSGWSECAYAAILGVQLGGTNIYKGIARHKPLLGDPDSAIGPAKIYQALQLTRTCFLLWLGIAILGLSIS